MVSSYKDNTLAPDRDPYKFDTGFNWPLANPKNEIKGTKILQAISGLQRKFSF